MVGSRKGGGVDIGLLGRICGGAIGLVLGGPVGLIGGVMIATGAEKEWHMGSDYEDDEC
jgi:hypothetical protein